MQPVGHAGGEAAGNPSQESQNSTDLYEPPDPDDVSWGYVSPGETSGIGSWDNLLEGGDQGWQSPTEWGGGDTRLPKQGPDSVTNRRTLLNPVVKRIFTQN